jgi:L-alanine-DL-glutamate epimerase-like enolase superfamily enzyme
MKISAVEATPFRLPRRKDFRWTGLQAGIGRFVLVRLYTDEGAVGLGEAAPLAEWGGDHGRHSGETQLTVRHMVEEVIGPALVGVDPLNIQAISTMMDEVVSGHSYAKAAIDIALHDLLGKTAGLPVYQLLGGAIRETLPIAHMVGLMPLQEAVDEAASAVSDGVGALQIKGGVDAERDIALIAALRERLGTSVWLRLDANQGYRDAKTAVGIIRRMEEFGIDAVEQPVAGLERMAEVRAQVNTLIIADESCWGPWDAFECAVGRGADAISIYLAKAGGITGARKVAAVAEAAGLPCDVNGSLESGIGNAANLHFALASTVVRLPCVIPMSATSESFPYPVAGNYYEDDIVTAPFPVAGGSLLPLTGPGLGVELDEGRLERFREG